MAPVNAMVLCTEACKADNVSLMEQAIAVASMPDSRHAVHDVVQRGLRRSAARNAVHVLRYVLDRGADVRDLSAGQITVNDFMLKPSQDVLEILVAHGWDINTLGPHNNSWPLLWLVISYPDLVSWCLDHGARVDIPDVPPRVNADGTESRIGPPRPTILGMAASSGNIEIFDLLRAKNPPMDPRALHRAVEVAARLAPQDTANAGQSYRCSMAMVRHLVDVVKIDVNAVHYQAGESCCTPLCYVAQRSTRQDCRELVDYLLDRGADPHMDTGVHNGLFWPSAVACAQSSNNMRFLELIKERQASQKGDRTSESVSGTIV
nr:hypothetical protein CFP56_75513 [Quercus suber]